MINSFSYPGDVYDVIRSHYRNTAQEVDFLESYGLSSGMHVLDVGCATGVLMRALADKGIHCTGIDSSPSFTEHGRKEIKAKNLANLVTIAEAKIQDYKFAKAEFNFVTCLFNTISYLNSYEEVEAALSSIRSSLKEKGVLVLEFAFYLNFVGSFKDTMVINHFSDKINITRLIKHSVNPHRATWGHEETLLIQRPGVPVETYFESQPQIVILPPVMEQILRRAGFSQVEFWGTWDKGRRVVGHSTCIAVAT